MRFEGTVKTWHDDRGFGFIEPLQGGQEIFFHIKVFGVRGARPQINQLVSFEVELGPQGKKRAKNVSVVRVPRRQTRLRPQSPAQWGAASLFAIPAFALLYAVVGILWRPPALLLLAYLGVSLITFVAYALDKSASRRGARRTPESTLHLLALPCGWPGFLIAQQVLRHKSSKAEFRSTFWATVTLNVAAFVALWSPVGRSLWAT